MSGRHARRRPAAPVRLLVAPAAVTAVLVGAGAAAAAGPACAPPPPGSSSGSPAALLGSVQGRTTPAGPGTGTPTTAVTAASSPGDPVGVAAAVLGDYVRQEHFNRGIGGQIQDATQFDTWARDHQVLARRALDPELDPPSALSSGAGTGPLVKELDENYWGTSPAHQIARIADFDSWNLAQIELARRVADPAVGEHSPLATTPGVGVVLHHLDNGHWNQSVNGQVTAITDGFPDWYAMHAQMLQDSTQSLQAGSAHDDHHGPEHTEG
ncbi:MAG TPA: hypothetical protein VHV82_05580 [Sporichthyaceae bacterium]|nr:hypothetical protein [Sporichthyaceae bacterium]